MPSTFWQNRICERQSCQNRHTGPNSLQKGKTVRFSWKLFKTVFSGHAEHVLAKSHFRASKLSKWSNWPEIVLKTGKLHFPWKLYKTLFSDHAQHVLAKSHSWASKWWKLSHWPQILSKKGKQCAFHENCTKRSFQVMRSTFWPNRIFERQSCQNRHTGLKFSLKRENSAFSMKIVQNALFTSCAARIGQIAYVSVKVLKIVSHTGLKFSSKRENSVLFMKIVQNALFRSCAARFGQIAFLSVKVLKIVTLAWNSLQNGKTVRFSWKLYKTLFSDNAQHVLPKSHFWGSKFWKSSHSPEILFKKGKQCGFHENCTKRSFQIMRSTFWPKSHFWGSNFWKSLHLSQILFKTGKQCAFHENCTKRSF